MDLIFSFIKDFETYTHTFLPPAMCEAVIKTKKSKTGKYISITIVLKLKNAEEVISYYKKVENIKGIISL